MKTFLKISLALLLFGVRLSAQPVHCIYDAINCMSLTAAAAPFNSAITIQPWPMTNSVSLYGVHFIPGVPTTFTPTNAPGGTNATLDLYLWPNTYRLTIAGIPQALLFPVSSNSATVEIASLITSGAVVTYPLPGNYSVTVDTNDVNPGLLATKLIGNGFISFGVTNIAGVEYLQANLTSSNLNISVSSTNFTGVLSPTNLPAAVAYTPSNNAFLGTNTFAGISASNLVIGGFTAGLITNSAYLSGFSGEPGMNGLFVALSSIQVTNYASKYFATFAGGQWFWQNAAGNTRFTTYTEYTNTFTIAGGTGPGGASVQAPSSSGPMVWNGSNVFTSLQSPNAVIGGFFSGKTTDQIGLTNGDFSLSQLLFLGQPQVDWKNDQLNDTAGTLAIDWSARQLYDLHRNPFLSYAASTNATIYGNLAVTGAVSASSFNLTNGLTAATVSASAFSGNASGLTNVQGSNIVGSVSNAATAAPGSPILTNGLADILVSNFSAYVSGLGVGHYTNYSNSSTLGLQELISEAPNGTNAYTAYGHEVDIQAGWYNITNPVIFHGAPHVVGKGMVVLNFAGGSNSVSAFTTNNVWAWYSSGSQLDKMAKAQKISMFSTDTNISDNPTFENIIFRAGTNVPAILFSAFGNNPHFVNCYFAGPDTFRDGVNSVAPNSALVLLPSQVHVAPAVIGLFADGASETVVSRCYFSDLAYGIEMDNSGDGYATFDGVYTSVIGQWANNNTNFYSQLWPLSIGAGVYNRGVFGGHLFGFVPYQNQVCFLTDDTALDGAFNIEPFTVQADTYTVGIIPTGNGSSGIGSVPFPYPVNIFTNAANGAFVPSGSGSTGSPEADITADAVNIFESVGDVNACSWYANNVLVFQVNIGSHLFYVGPNYTLTTAGSTVVGSSLNSYAAITATNFIGNTIGLTNLGGFTGQTNATAPGNTSVIKVWINFTNASGGVFKLGAYQ